MPRIHSNVALALWGAAACSTPSLAMPSLRRGGGDKHVALVASNSSDPITADTDMKSVVSGIHEKWDKMGDFMEIMFMIACKAKHGEDVSGHTAEKLKNEEIHHDDAMDFRKKLQKNNMNQLNGACGKIVAKGKGPCRQRCADGFGSAMQQRHACDEKCVKAYDSFEANCNAKAANLEQIYKMKNDVAESRKRCHEGHCYLFPNVWMAAEADQQTEVDVGCAGRCTEDNIKLSCEKEFALQLDFTLGEIKQTCFEGSTAPACYEGKSATVDTDHDTCNTDGTTECDTQHTECTTKGETDSASEEAAAFCDERKTMCQEQVAKKCLKEHKAGLDAAFKECEATAKDELKTCETDAVDAKKTEDVDACVAETTPICTAKCNADCNVTAMNECLGNLDSADNATEMFCSDFWHMLHDSSEVDPSTGNPIVLLTSHAVVAKPNATKVNADVTQMVAQKTTGPAASGADVKSKATHASTSSASNTKVHVANASSFKEIPDPKIRHGAL